MMRGCCTDQHTIWLQKTAWNREAPCPNSLQDWATDVYAFGGTMIFMLTGREPLHPLTEEAALKATMVKPQLLWSS